MQARDRLISSAVDLIRRNGVAGTGLALLLELSGTARRSLYLNFPGGKAELIADATAVAGKVTGAAIDRLARDGDPVVVIQRFIAGWTDALRATDFTAGCPIVAAALGRSEASVAADTAGEVFTDWERRLTGHLQEADLSPADAAQLATMTVAAVEGAIIMCQATKSDEPLRRVEAGLIELYQQKSHRG
ncbi:TetR/AcrR family transcriptional regulator [Mycolicibacterium fluoranthenivorans]|uniref:AcrR family transcriptional regulator n=1 Tax=Mycolicibacterium fluoranthenivorans TaxID=258505 RepID=A0A7X5U2G2_9MYCO|nr:TetR family transcriptional regulator [Mycolicibacterium fluoranthenivorans]MCV7354223.1 TetR/AcrR family transcriptional regulator [Mycolicibacterium fluoranthenivorans]NIH97207.1 AcrR family transcriptional regulator [Mycolicibacterium fluoranthenivorans]